MTTETAEEVGVNQTTEGTDGEDSNDSDFDSGFDGNNEQTTTPAASEDMDKPAPEAAPPAASAEPEPAPKLAQITEDQFKALMDKAAEVDQIKADSKRQIDTLAGHLGGMKQLVEGLKQRGQMTPGQLKRVTAEFPEIGKLLEEDLSELAGTPAQAVDPEEIDRRAQAIVAKAVTESEVKAETKWIGRQHKDWVEVVRSQEFINWSQTLSPEQQQQLMGNDGEFIADRITDFKAVKAAKDKADQEAAAKASASTNRKQRLEAAVPPKGTGGHAPAPPEDDEFEAGFKTG